LEVSPLPEVHTSAVLDETPGGNPPRRPWVPLVVGLALIGVLVGGGLTLVSNRSGSGEGGVALAFSFHRGQTFRFHLQKSFKGTVRDVKASVVRPYTKGFGGDFAWTVASVDANGVATVDVKAENLSASLDGHWYPTEGGGTARIRIASDGRILSLPGELSPGSSLGFAGSDQVTPLLPNYAVKPGDSWTRNFDQAIPVGGWPKPPGPLHFDQPLRSFRDRGWGRGGRRHQPHYAAA
jgi:hypothetical protein